MANFVRITPDMTEAAIKHLRMSFFVDEPLNHAVGLVERGTPHADLERMIARSIADGLSIATFQDDHILGVAINGIFKPGDLENAIEKLKESKDEKFKKVFTVLYTLNKSVNVFEKYEVDRLMECRIISISERARGRGLGKELIRRSIEIAKEEGFKIFKADATGVYSQNICRQLGFKIIARLQYADYRDKDGQPLNVEPPHKELAIMILDFNPVDPLFSKKS